MSAGPVLARYWFFFCFLLFSPPPAHPAEAVPGDTLVIGVLSQPANLHPVRDWSFSKSFLFGFINRSLVARGESWMASCFLCAEVPTLANGGLKVVELPDHRRGLDAMFEIRPMARWADGVPVTSRDMRFTMEVARTVGAQNEASNAYRHLNDITIVDDRRFVLHFDEVNYTFVTDSALFLIPEHIEGPRFRAAATAADYLDHSAYRLKPDEAGLWNGPYRVASWAEHEITLAANPYWNGHPAQFKKIILREIPELSALRQALVSGTVDYVPGESGLPPAEALDLAAAYPDRFEFVSKPGLHFGHVDLNLANPLLADRRVRQALLLGLDRSEMLRRVFPDPRPVADNFMPPFGPEQRSPGRTYPTDPAQAKALLAEAGFSPGPDGVLVDAAGRRFSIDLAMSTVVPTNFEQGRWLQSSWAALGIEVRLNFYPVQTLLTEILPHHRFDAAYYIWVFGPENAPVNLFGTQSIPTEANGFSGQNYSSFSNAGMDAALAELVVELDPKKRAPIWSRVREIYADELPGLPLFFQDQAYLVPRWLVGLGPVGHNTPTSFWVENWRAEPPVIPPTLRGAAAPNLLCDRAC